MDLSARPAGVLHAPDYRIASARGVGPRSGALSMVTGPFALSAILLLPAGAVCGEEPAVIAVAASAETEPVSSADDAADDPAIWVHPSDPALSLIIGTNKQAGLAVYGLDGHLIQTVGEGLPNNVDLRCGIPFGSDSADIVAASDRDGNVIRLFRVDSGARRLEELTSSRIQTGLTEVYGLCMARGPAGETWVLVNDKDGRIQQWALDGRDDGTVDARLARTVSVSSQPEGMVADDALGFLYVGEEDAGIWKFDLAPDSTAAPRLVDRADGGGHVVADVEGLAIYPTSCGGGYLIASSQGDNTFAVYERAGANAFVCSLRIAGAAGVDGAEETDGLEVVSAGLGPAFPFGMLVVQDGDNTGSNQNFKLVAWEAVARAVGEATGRPLVVDSTGGCAADARPAR
jgi:3-phytase